MSYCRFQNTVRDFADCLDAINNPDGALSDEEQRAAVQLIIKAQRLVAIVADEIAVDMEDDLKPDDVRKFVAAISDVGGRNDDDEDDDEDDLPSSARLDDQGTFD
jgi:hypothetical protein